MSSPKMILVTVIMIVAALLPMVVVATVPPFSNYGRIAEGKKLWHQNGCIRCHGANAAGGNAVPPLINKNFRDTYKVMESYNDTSFKIREGSDPGWCAKKRYWDLPCMPSFKEHMTEDEIRMVIDFIRTLQK
ncbi:MAG: cytochrome c [Armatimonadetes bacterium]|nr:cytochrome c [Armatimonadota bacterium]